MPVWRMTRWPLRRIESAILLVAQDLRIRELIRRDLSRDGHKIIVAASAEEAVRTTARHERQIDLLCTDTQLPTLTGPELAQIVKLDYPDVKVVYMSNGGKDGRPLRDPGSKVVTIQDPFRSDGLREVIREMLSPRSLLKSGATGMI
jgi:two-component system cell cycle sensor histidine kinase/response regulator CckA